MSGLIVFIILLIMNLVIVKFFGELEFWFVLIKVIVILVLIVIGFVMIFKGFFISLGVFSFINFWSYGGLFLNGMYGFIFLF